jgi:uncharacterized protein YggE
MKLLRVWCLACLAGTLVGQTIQVNKENRTVAVTVTDEAEALADVAVVSIGFHIYGTDQTQTYAEGTRVSNAVMDAVRSAGIKPEAIVSRNQNLSEIDDNDKARYAKGIRFEFSQGWAVTVPAASAAETIHAAVLAGANDSGGIEWRLKNSDALEDAAAEKALGHARELAGKMVRGLGGKLGPLVYASNQAPGRMFGGVQLQTESASAMISARKVNLKPLAISPDRMSRSATVYAVFAVE